MSQTCKEAPNTYQVFDSFSWSLCFCLFFLPIYGVGKGLPQRVSVLSFFVFYSGGIHGMQVFPSFAEEEPPQAPPERGALHRRFVCTRLLVRLKVFYCKSTLQLLNTHRLTSHSTCKQFGTSIGSSGSTSGFHPPGTSSPIFFTLCTVRPQIVLRITE